MFRSCSPFDFSYDLSDSIINREFRVTVVRSREVDEIVQNAREFAEKRDMPEVEIQEVHEEKKHPTKTQTTYIDEEPELVIESSMIDRFGFVAANEGNFTPRKSVPTLHTCRFGCDRQVMLNPMPFVPSIPPKSPRTPRQERRALVPQGTRMISRLVNRRTGQVGRMTRTSMR